MSLNPNMSTASPLKRRVIKLGGSLLDLPEIATRLNSVLKSWPAMANFVVVGGGQAANLIREWDEQWELGNQRSHRMAIFAMTWNAKQQFGNHACFERVRNVKSLPNADQTGVILAEPFLNSLAGTPGQEPLAESWDVTSDTIAAVIAGVLCAEQLVMLKSIDCTASTNSMDGRHLVAGKNLPFAQVAAADRSFIDISDIEILKRLAEAGHVDFEFPKFASKIPSVSWCNFRRLMETLEQ